MERDKNVAIEALFLFGALMKIDIRERFLRIREVVHRTGMSRGTIYNKIHAGTFPKQIPIGANLVVWLERDVQQWMQEQVDKSRG
ncbi:helix-turn-helix transcriptional regulator [Prochlorococcus marinus]|nr:AlpA family transcriptional regulator [Prochlorococcus marinus]